MAEEHKSEFFGGMDKDTGKWRVAMNKIFFNDHLIWFKPYLPSEIQARVLLSKYAPKANWGEADLALSAGLDVQTPEGYFMVVLPTDKYLTPKKVNHE